MRRAALAALAVALVASACGGLTTKEDAARQQAEEEAPRSYGGGAGAASPTPSRSASATRAASTTGTLRVRIRNADGRTTAGIPLRYRGPKSGTVVTTSKGVASATLPPGTYEISTPAGCGDVVEIFQGSGGTAGLPAGRTVSIDLTVDWRHRIAPWPTVDVRTTNPFPRGEPVEIRYLVQDRCANEDAVRGAFPRFAFTAGSGIALAGTPVMTSGGDGYASVTVRCTAAGNPSLRIADRDNPADGFDLLEVRSPPDPSRPWCA